ncbi:hypothetical protein N7475_010496 [Penicillium sp. IBT 31633x]|nr:hypothetical protein N7475_010496 [Penicillium sp. IBT 31633x]
MIRPGMFHRPDGSNIPEPEIESYVHWVTVDFSEFIGHARPNSGESMMRLMAEQCRSGNAAILPAPQHHHRPFCLSLPVVGDPGLKRVQILAQAAELADWHWEEIMASRESVDVTRIMGDYAWWTTTPVSGS